MFIWITIYFITLNYIWLVLNKSFHGPISVSWFYNFYIGYLKLYLLTNMWYSWSSNFAIVSSGECTPNYLLFCGFYNVGVWILFVVTFICGSQKFWVKGKSHRVNISSFQASPNVELRTLIIILSASSSVCLSLFGAEISHLCCWVENLYVFSQSYSFQCFPFM